MLNTYGLPGNIRELKNMIDNAWNRTRTRSWSLAYLRDYVRNNSNQQPPQDVQLTFSGSFPTLQEVDRPW